MSSYAPLRGVRVVAVEQAISAPLASRHLADLGADVIKVERTDGGDFARAYDSTVRGLSSWFVWVGRGKRSLTLDLKMPQAAEIMARLIARADVFIQNLAPGAIERLGLGGEALRARYPRLIVCNISGYGPDGPLRDRKAYDLLLQGEGGVLAVTGTPAEPAKAGISVADIAAGMYALSGILAALYERERTGEGTVLDIAMIDAIAEWVSAPLYFAQYGGTPPQRAGMRHSGIVPYGPYRCADGAVNLAIQNEREWARFCAGVLGRPELARDPRFDRNAHRLANRQELEALIEHYFAALSVEEVERRLEEADIPFGRVNDLAGVWEHPQLRARHRFATVGSPVGEIEVMRHPINARGAEAQALPVPALGEHTDEILAEIGFSSEERAALRQQGVV
ncbi:MAG: CaiB/BaiF CoA-transferase family protein [Chloroflexota bacterium]|nr:CoA transferase [Dehalococcoidia bacterium]MDW8253261.1 CaiB/BaiF CoA-transferase family protein [Chloroflexota bacterium]